MGIFKDMLFPHERPNWSDKDGKVKLPRDSILLPIDGDWKWQTEWIVEIDNNFHDKKGWSYANDFNGPFKRSRGLFDLVRRRKWVRYAIMPRAAPAMLGNKFLDSRASKIMESFDSQRPGAGVDTSIAASSQRLQGEAESKKRR